MSIILSCGHREDDFDKHHSIIVRSCARDFSLAIGYMTVCADCKQYYADNGLLFETESDAMKWLTAGDVDEPSN